MSESASPAVACTVSVFNVNESLENPLYPYYNTSLIGKKFLRRCFSSSYLLFNHQYNNSSPPLYIYTHSNTICVHLSTCTSPHVPHYQVYRSLHNGTPLETGRTITALDAQVRLHVSPQASRSLIVAGISLHTCLFRQLRNQ